MVLHSMSTLTPEDLAMVIKIPRVTLGFVSNRASFIDKIVTKKSLLPPKLTIKRYRIEIARHLKIHLEL